MVTFRILLFSMLAALALYVPFYYFAPVYHPLYVHVPDSELNQWDQWAFNGEHGGIQIYLAYILMYLAVGLTAFFEYIYVRFFPAPARWAALAAGVMACLYYLWTIRFHPSMADIRVDGKGIIFITVAVITAFILGRFFDRKAVKWLVLFLLFMATMALPGWRHMCAAYFNELYPAFRTLKGYALNQSYFQYDHLTSLLAMAWMKLGLPLDRFYNIGGVAFFAFFTGVYFLARNLFSDKQLAVYFILSLVIIKIYGNIVDPVMGLSVTPLRLDMWLVLLGLAYWKGPQHWTVGLALGFFLVFHHAFGTIYSVAYALLAFTLLILHFSKDTIKRFIPNVCMMIGGELINRIFINSNNTVPGLDFVKYNIGFMPIDPRSFFWYVPVVMSAAVLLLWKSRTLLPQRYFQTGIFLVLLAIGNLLYFFGRSHENNLINIAASPWLVFFMMMDLVVLRMPANAVKRTLIPLAGVLIVGMAAFFYSVQALVTLKSQATALSTLGDLLKPDSTPDMDFKTLKAVTRGNPKIVFLSVNHDFEYYYYGGYDPVEPRPTSAQFFLLNLTYILNNRLSKGYDIIVPLSENDSVQENILLLDAKYVYKISDFVYISNNQPAL